MMIRVFILLAVIGGAYYLYQKSQEKPPFIKCGKCEGKGYWIALRGGKDKCDNCGGSGKVAR